MLDGLYYLDKDTSSKVNAVISCSPLEEFTLLHQRLGNIPFVTLRKLYPKLYSRVNTMKLSCDACEFGKNIRSSYMLSENRTIIPLHTIHSDVWVLVGLMLLMDIDIL
jgi:hypothetical protein